MIDDLTMETYVNASYIKSPYNEEAPISESEAGAPFGHIIASQGP
jgi:hypothetical protein